MSGRILLLVSCLFLSAAPCAAAEPFESYAEKLEGFNARLEFVPVKGGIVRMKPVGNRPAAEVKINDMFVGKTEVPWQVFDVFATSMDRTDAERAADDEKPRALRLRPSQVYHDRDHGFGHAGNPAISMRFYSAVKFCEWLSARTGKTYRLPTEAEFEYFARAGREDEAFTDDAVLAEAWGKENAEDATHPLAERKANPFGLHDVLGNVAEWVTPLDGDKPVARGGSWRTPTAKLRPWLREVEHPKWNLTDPSDPKSVWWLRDGPFVGFRVVRER
jgi:formylglycine-generating enzyme